MEHDHLQGWKRRYWEDRRNPSIHTQQNFRNFCHWLLRQRWWFCPHQDVCISLKHFKPYLCYHRYHFPFFKWLLHINCSFHNNNHTLAFKFLFTLLFFGLFDCLFVRFSSFFFVFFYSEIDDAGKSGSWFEGAPGDSDENFKKVFDFALTNLTNSIWYAAGKFGKESYFEVEIPHLNAPVMTVKITTPGQQKVFFSCAFFFLF